jgi:hypothetical protein
MNWAKILNGRCLLRFQNTLHPRPFKGSADIVPEGYRAVCWSRRPEPARVFGFRNSLQGTLLKPGSRRFGLDPEIRSFYSPTPLLLQTPRRIFKLMTFVTLPA